MIFDLDPGEGTAWSHIQKAAILVRTLLTELGLESWLKTRGRKGLHIVVPLTPRFDYGTVKSSSQAIVQHLARTLPSRFVAKSGLANRIGSCSSTISAMATGQQRSHPSLPALGPGLGSPSRCRGTSLQSLIVATTGSSQNPILNFY